MPPSLRSAMASIVVLASSVAAAAVELPDSMELSIFKSFEANGLAARKSAESMGPAALMWPADRDWSAGTQTSAPCGSIGGAGNRTQFPMKNGKIALISKKETWDLEVSVSYLEDPKSSTDFTPLIKAESFRELAPGHTCVSIEDAPPSVKSGAKATIQLKYTSQFDKPQRETFYACADITYVELSDFGASIPCFNSTNSRSGEGRPSANEGSGSAVAASPSASGGGSSFSTGAMAGVAIGSIAGASALALAGLFLYRKLCRRRSSKMLQKQPARGSKWEDQEIKEHS